jgi:hypothetical protein
MVGIASLFEQIRNGFFWQSLLYRQKEINGKEGSLRSTGAFIICSGIFLAVKTLTALGDYDFPFLHFRV